MRNGRVGKIIKTGDVSPWPHEEATAKALALYEHNVKFIRKSNRDREHSADAFVDGEKWEFKAPRSRLLSAVERNLRRGKKQSTRIVFDSRRMKGVPDEAIMREIASKAHLISKIQRIVYINKHGEGSPPKQVAQHSSC